MRVEGTIYTRLTAYCLVTVYGHYQSDKQEKELVSEWAREYMMSLGGLSQSTFTLDSWAEAGAFLVFLRKQGFLESNEFPESCEQVFPNSLTRRLGVDFELTDLLLLPALWNARGATGEAAKAAYVAGESLTEQSWDQLAGTVKNVGSPRTRAALAGIARNARNEIPDTSDILKFGNGIEKSIPSKSASVYAGKKAMKRAGKIDKNPSSVVKNGHELVGHIPYKGSAVKKGKQAFKGARELGWEASKELGRFNGNGHLQQVRKLGTQVSRNARGVTNLAQQAGETGVRIGKDGLRGLESMVRHGIRKVGDFAEDGFETVHSFTNLINGAELLDTRNLDLTGNIVKAGNSFAANLASVGETFASTGPDVLNSILSSQISL
jgi:hypothetical protein